MTEINTCILCQARPCEKTKKGTFDICEYGIAFHNTGKQIRRKAPHVTLRNLATNLRHEINPILQLVIQEAGKINPEVSTRVIDLNEPSSKIVGATVIIDYLIQMITGVNDFQSTPPERIATPTNPPPLSRILHKYFTIHGILKNQHRAEGLKLLLAVDKKLCIAEAPDIYEYILCILLDNTWKYSLSRSTVKVITRPSEFSGYYHLIIRNSSLPLDPELELFAFGVKGSSLSKGFGYGLHWARVLSLHLNDMRGTGDPPMELQHRQISAKVRSDVAIQEFTILNAKLELRK